MDPLPPDDAPRPKLPQLSETDLLATITARFHADLCEANGSSPAHVRMWRDSALAVERWQDTHQELVGLPGIELGAEGIHRDPPYVEGHDLPGK